MEKRFLLPYWVIKSLKGVGENMSIWEVINWSDPITILSDDFDVATAAIMVLSYGKYSVKECGGQKRESPLFGLWKIEQTAQWLKENFPEKELEGNPDQIVEKFLESIDVLQMAQVLHSMQVCSPEEREGYEEALKAIDNTEKKIEYTNWWKERRRSSMNDIVHYAWHMADRLEEKHKKENAVA